jgi:L-amino acid N-acyltransferase YncA
VPRVPIRDAEPDRDAAACAAIYAPYVRETAVSLETEPPSPDQFAARIVRLSASYPFLVVDEGAGAVGFAYGSQHRERPGYRWAADVSVYLAASARGRGLGRSLYSELIGRLTEQGFWIACAGITLPNPESVGLHESFGFERVGVYRRIGWKAGAWRDVAWYQRPLREAVDGTQPPEPGPPEPAPPR